MVSQAAQLCVTYYILYVLSFFALVLLEKFPVLALKLHYLTIVKEKKNYSYAMHAKDSENSCHSQCDQQISICSVRLTEITCLSKGTAQLQSCYDRTGCGGNVVTGVSIARNCCLGSGLSFRDGSGICRQCIGKQLRVRGIYLVCWWQYSFRRQECKSDMLIQI